MKIYNSSLRFWSLEAGNRSEEGRLLEEERCNWLSKVAALIDGLLAREGVEVSLCDTGKITLFIL